MKSSGPPERRVGLGRGPGPARKTPLNPGKGFGQDRKPLERRTELRATAPAPRVEQGAPKPRTRSSSGSTEVPTRVRTFVYRRDDDTCARCGLELRPGNRQLQHRVARGSGGRGRKVDAHRLSALVLLCGTSPLDPDGCHWKVESQPERAKREGYRVPDGFNPEEVPVLWHDGKRYILCDDGDRYPVVDQPAPP